jgi:hypothetical protein
MHDVRGAVEVVSDIMTAIRDSFPCVAPSVAIAAPTCSRTRRIVAP